MSALKQRATRARGMTLIEVMISFAILVTGLVSIFAILNAGFRSHKRAVNETEAAILADSVLSELRAEFARGNEPTSDRNGTFHEHPDFPNYAYSRIIEPLEKERKGIQQAGANTSFFTRVVVRWSDQGDDKSIAVDTVMFCNRK
ncbi:MAG TPA: prepilin-type N-terminal cleavage/methylation domain-containing protein [Planctomycetota bacterium]|nr:prepilin-type N-terminal cleavage/methylation domain-containing protein [Planctomycetota bacterium]